MSTTSAFLLETGLSVHVKHLPQAQTASCGVWVKQGSMDEDVSNNGTSHLLEHVLMHGGTAGDQARSSLLNRMGARLNAATGKDATYFYVTVEPKWLPSAIGVLSGLVTVHPTALALQQQRPVVLQEHAGYLKSAERIHDCLARLFWGDRGPGLPVMGNEGVLRSCGLEDLAVLHRAAYRPDRAAVAVVGPVAPEACRNWVDQSFSHWTAADPAAMGIMEPESRAKVGPSLERLAGPSGFVTLCVGWHLAGEDVQAGVGLLMRLLGNGTPGRLGRELRDRRGLAYYTGAYTVFYRDVGYLAAMARCREEDAETTLAVILDQCGSLAAVPAPDEEFSAARALHRTESLLEQERSLRQLVHVGRAAILGAGSNPATFLETINLMTPEQVRALAEKLFRPEHLAVVAAGHCSGASLERVVLRTYSPNSC